jgi:D-alanyl-D-alanine carboxypeptidase (penicillin-binding protein 5/6)
MSSPLQGGRRRRRGGGSVRRRRRGLPVPGRGTGLVLLVLLAAAGVAAWLLVGKDAATVQPPVAAIHQPLVSQETSTRPPAKPRAGAPPPGIALFGGGRPVKLHFKNPPRAGLVFDVDSGHVLWARRPLERLPMASLTKLMTAIIVVERTRPTERARVTKEALGYSGSGVGVLPKNKRVPVEGLLAGMLLPSGNDAALALADHLAGTDKRFVRLMNERARVMGLGCTHYASSYGLPDTNRSCAADLAALSRLAMSKPRIARIVRKPSAKLRFPIKGGFLYLNSTNPLLRDRFPGTIGLKTGSTDKAGHCFIGIARRAGRTYGVVLLHSPNTLAQSEKLLTAAFRMRR